MTFDERQRLRTAVDAATRQRITTQRVMDAASLALFKRDRDEERAEALERSRKHMQERVRSTQRRRQGQR